MNSILKPSILKSGRLKILYITLFWSFGLLLFSHGFSQSTSQTSTTELITQFTPAQESCIEEKLSMSAGTEGYIFSNYNFREDFYKLDAEASYYLETLAKILASKNINLVKVTPLLKSITENEYLSKENPKHLAFSVTDNLEQYHSHLQKLETSGVTAPNFYTSYVQDHNEENFYIDYDSHWNILGARLAALAISEAIKSNPVYDTLDKVTFKTTAQGNYEFFGISKALSKNCAIEIGPFKSKNLFTTVAETVEEETSSQLFTEESYPVVVVGTSFSFKPFNFIGFLSESLSLNVLNWSQPNAKLEGSILSFFVSDTYQESPPQFLIWESANFAFANSVKQLRQIVPAATGGCKVVDALYKDSFSIQTSAGPETHTLFEDLENITANNHFLELSYIGHTVNSKIDLIRIYSKYTDAAEDIKFLDHRFFDNQHRIFYLFNHLEHDLNSVSISLPQDIDITLEARICPLIY